MTTAPLPQPSANKVVIQNSTQPSGGRTTANQMTTAASEAFEIQELFICCGYCGSHFYLHRRE